MAKQLLSASLKGGMNFGKVTRAMDNKERKVLYKTSAYARTTMRRGMRRKKGPGKVGGYPAAHSGELKDLIAFAVDLNSGTSVIGPAIFSKQSNDIGGGASTVPELINKSGTQKLTSRGKTVVARYNSRPFVKLATDLAAKKFADNMKNIPL